MVGPRDVILRDGTTLRLRAPARDDADALLDFFRGLSEQSLYRRFHGMPAVRPQLVEPYLDADSRESGSLVGTLVRDGSERIVAIATWIRLREPTVAEVAFAVEDALQGRGLGSRLLEELAATAAAAGVADFVAEVLPDNRPMLEVFASAGFATSRRAEGGTVEVRLSVAPTAAYRARVDERDHVGVAASLRPFFAPRTVAVLGASPRRGSIGGELFRNVLAADFAGAAYPVNRDGTPVAGVRAFARLDEVPDTIDLAVVCLPGPLVLDAVRGALGAGVRAFCVISAGFAETGEAGAARQDELLALVRSYGGRLIGPNCLGLAVAAPRLNATFAPRSFPPGRIAFSSQSGALGLALLEEAGARGLGLSAFVSVGNKADVSSNDLLEWWEDDPETAVILLYLESFGNPRKFARLAQRVARGKPILALKSGSTRAGRPGRELAHGGAGGVRGGRQRPLPPGRRDPRRHARRPARRRGAAQRAAAPARAARRRADQRGRPRHPVRRRHATRRACTCLRWPTRRSRRCGPRCRRRPAWRTRSTCSVRRPRCRTRRRCRSCCATPTSTR